MLAFIDVKDNVSDTASESSRSSLDLEFFAPSTSQPSDAKSGLCKFITFFLGKLLVRWEAMQFLSVLYLSFLLFFYLNKYRHSVLDWSSFDFASSWAHEMCFVLGLCYVSVLTCLFDFQIPKPSMKIYLVSIFYPLHQRWKKVKFQRHTRCLQQAWRRYGSMEESPYHCRKESDLNLVLQPRVFWNSWRI